MSDNNIAPEQIIINGREFDPEQAARLVELGEKWETTEKELNTPLDKVYPEYTKSRQQLKDLEEQKAIADKELEQYRQAEEASKKKSETPEEILEALEAGRKIGFLDRETLKNEGYMTRAEVEDFLNQKSTNDKLVATIEEEGRKLETEINGSDGRIPFEYKAVLPYAATYRIDNLKDAYDQMYARANKPWIDAQLAKEQSKGLTTLKSNGAKKEPAKPKITNDNLEANLAELLNGVSE